MQIGYFDTVLIAVITFHLLQAPFTKVEESFTIQAIHDILKYGIFDVSKYDHNEFPGAVPRSFIGPLIIALFTKPLVVISSWYRGHQFDVHANLDAQIFARGIIGLFNGLSILYLKNCVQTMFSNERKKRAIAEEKRQEETQSIINKATDLDMYTVGSWFVVFCICSFHLMFYASRPLPNFVLAFTLTNIAMGKVLLSNYGTAILICSFASVVLRLELIGLTFGFAVSAYALKKIAIIDIVKFGIIGSFIGLGLSLGIDSHFWGEWCIPELDSFLFNVVEGNSSDWGTEPFIAYFTHYLRMIFLPPTILLLNYMGFVNGLDNTRIVGLASYIHIFILSFQPHKEWRFIVYSLPGIILLGSIGASHLWERVDVNSGTIKFILSLLLPLSAFASFIVSIVFSIVSNMNYPGGEALVKFNNYIVENNIKNVSVHLTVPACMTGVTLFGELDHDVYGVNYDKTENITKLNEIWPSIDYVIATESDPNLFPINIENESKNWKLINTSETFSHVDTSFLIDLFFAEDKKSLFRTVKSVMESEITWHDIIHKTFKSTDVLFIFERISIVEEQQ